MQPSGSYIEFRQMEMYGCNLVQGVMFVCWLDMLDLCTVQHSTLTTAS